MRFLTNKNNLIAEQSVEWSVLLTEFEQSVSDQLKGLVEDLMIGMPQYFKDGCLAEEETEN